ncbi:tripartite tricarboxylate transporter TctB family protein [Aquibacillus sediminis]|uniref:tripartite tricarboxylate transporter TctB family protein n=1 Tax=Aquibacillus sediminis TaxID=2574734 RepID=UPI00110862EA|nr:tripartite tricarboxylate transporter TctB family protein [Aquibacillus sediminis]
MDVKEFFTIEMSYSTYHLVFPRIIMFILIVMGSFLLIRTLVKKSKDRENSAPFKFFTNHYDRVKFYGTIILLTTYAAVLQHIGFVLTSIIFMILLTLLFIGNLRKKSILVSITNGLTTTIVVWYVFGQLFDITLP